MKINNNYIKKANNIVQMMSDKNLFHYGMSEENKQALAEYLAFELQAVEKTTKTAIEFINKIKQTDENNY